MYRVWGSSNGINRVRVECEFRHEAIEAALTIVEESVGSLSPLHAWVRDPVDNRMLAYWWVDHRGKIREGKPL